MFFCVHCDPNRDVPSDEIDLNNPMIIKIYTLYDKNYCGEKYILSILNVEEYY